MRVVFVKLLIQVLFILLPTVIFAQKGVEDGSRYGHGKDSIQCIKNLSLYREYVKNNEYNIAIGFWRIVYNECPLATMNIYIDGVKMYNEFIVKETLPEKQSALVDTLMMIYDQRIKYYQQEGTVLGRQGVDLLRYKRNDLDKLEEGYVYLKRSLDLLKNKSSIAVIATFMQASYSLFENNRLNDIQVIEDFTMCSGIIDNLLASKPGDVNTNKVKESVDLGFILSGAPSCESLVTYFGAAYESKKSDVKFVKQVVTYLFRLDCISDPLYAKAAEDLYALEPSSQSAYNLAKLFMTKEDYDNAIRYYLEAIKSEEDADQKADYYYQLGVITNARLKKPEEARKFAMEALRIKPNWGEPYILIGDAYAASKDCFEDAFEKATVYWVAVDMFTKAINLDAETAEKATDRINTYSQYFPDVETVFFYGLQEGDSYKVGCWINETTKVRTK